MAHRPGTSIYGRLGRLRVGASKAAIFLLLLVLSNPRAFGWGCAGHQTVAFVALSQLNPGASAKAHELLQGQPVGAALCLPDHAR
jgi:hypothetical protein